MAKGTKYWARSYIILSNGQKVYLAEGVYDVEEKLKSNTYFVSFKISTSAILWPFQDERITVNKNTVIAYGRV